MLKTLGVHFIRHPCLTRTVRVRPPAPKKAGLCLFVVAEVWRGVELRPFGSLHRAATLCDRYRASMHDPHSASSPPGTKKAGLCLFVVAEVWRGVELRSFGSLHRAATLCDRHRASMHDPQVAGSPSRRTKNNAPLVERGIIFGADGGGRTRTVLLPTDFESVTSANSITSAY